MWPTIEIDQKNRGVCFVCIPNLQGFWFRIKFQQLGFLDRPTIFIVNALPDVGRAYSICSLAVDAAA